MAPRSTVTEKLWRMFYVLSVFLAGLTAAQPSKKVVSNAAFLSRPGATGRWCFASPEQVWEQPGPPRRAAGRSSASPLTPTAGGERRRCAPTRTAHARPPPAISGASRGRSALLCVCLVPGRQAEPAEDRRVIAVPLPHPSPPGERLGGGDRRGGGPARPVGRGGLGAVRLRGGVAMATPRAPWGEVRGCEHGRWGDRLRGAPRTSGNASPQWAVSGPAGWKGGCVTVTHRLWAAAQPNPALWPEKGALLRWLTARGGERSAACCAWKPALPRGALLWGRFLTCSNALQLKAFAKVIRGIVI